MSKKDYNKAWTLRNPEKAKESRRRYREKNKEKLALSQKEYRERTNYHRNYNLRTRYGLSPEEYDNLLHKQGNVCALCGGIDTKRKLAVDHCHNTGRVRGLLCKACNVSLGLLKENKQTILNMLEYLDNV